MIAASPRVSHDLLPRRAAGERRILLGFLLPLAARRTALSPWRCARPAERPSQRAPQQQVQHRQHQRGDKRLAATARRHRHVRITHMRRRQSAYSSVRWFIRAGVKGGGGLTD